MDSIINSAEYWESRFATGDWTQSGGDAQSAFFARLAAEHLPDWLLRELERKAHTVTDLGCADGAGTALLAKRFPLCAFTGVDFSAEAVRTAGERYPACDFRLGDVTKAPGKADIIFSSNTLEHLRSPGDVLRTWVTAAEKYAVLLLPFEDDSDIPEHFNTFSARTFPQQIGAYHMAHAEVIDCRRMDRTQWNGKQLLLIYAKQGTAAPDAVGFAEVYETQLGALIDRSHAQDGALEALRAEADGLTQEADALRAEIGRLTREAEALHTEIGTLTHKAEALRGSMAQARSDAAKQIRELRQELQRSERVEAQLREREEENASLLQLHEQTVNGVQSALVRVLEISRSLPYRAAHFAVELKHACFGTREERRSGWNWLLRDRGSYTRCNYMHELAVRLEQLTTARPAMQQTAEEPVDPDADRRVLEEIFRSYPLDTLVYLPPLVDWNIPLFQRPQQLAMAFADAGILFVYATPNGLDNVHAPVCLRENCILIPDRDTDLVKELAAKYGKRVVLDICSTDNHHFRRWLDGWRGVDTVILYEYIDEISDAITGSVPKATLRRHDEFLKDESVFVVATAEKLYREVVETRGSAANVLSSGNGVDLAHFQIEPDPSRIPVQLRSVCTGGKPIIGYFGAIANWFDFELLIAAAKARPNYTFLIIGPHYGDHDLPILEQVRSMPNIVMPGTVEYKTLPYVANCFTAATIPFVINDITLSTSPLKLFEYMAMGKPVVTTPMPECMKYPEVHIGADVQSYVQGLDEAVAQADDDEARRALVRIAEENSWQEKAREIAELIGIERRARV